MRLSKTEGVAPDYHQASKKGGDELYKDQREPDVPSTVDEKVTWANALVRSYPWWGAWVVGLKARAPMPNSLPNSQPLYRGQGHRPSPPSARAFMRVGARRIVCQHHLHCPQIRAESMPTSARWSLAGSPSTCRGSRECEGAMGGGRGPLPARRWGRQATNSTRRSSRAPRPTAPSRQRPSPRTHWTTSYEAPSTDVPATALPPRNVAPAMRVPRPSTTPPGPEPPRVANGTAVLPERLDEKPYQLLGEAREPLPMRPGDVAKVDSEYRRDGAVSVFVLCEPLVGAILQFVEPTRAAIDWADKVKHLVDVAAPGGDHRHGHGQSLMRSFALEI